MNKQEALQKNITIYWWNMGSKTLDFKGTYKDYLKKKDIKITKIKHPFSKDTTGLRFKIPLCSSIVRLDTFDSDIINSLDKAIMIISTLLGDKTKFNNGYGREYQINWR